MLTLEELIAIISLLLTAISFGYTIANNQNSQK